MWRFGLWSLLLLTFFCSIVHVYGQARCPDKTTASSCPRGKHTCTCPGDKKKITFHIDCVKKGGWSWWGCGKPRHSSNCGRYSLCHSCKNEVGYNDYNVCTKCLNKGYTGSQCKTDVNECASANAGCGQTCKNTIGSYYCQCNSGYSLAVNKHDCDRKSCGRPEEQDGLKMESDLVPGAEDFEYETSVKYSCSRLHHVIVGNSRQTCGLTKDESNVEWLGAIPHCVVECNPTEEHAQCGVAGVDPVVCDQLGCCYHEDLGTCHMRPGHIYIEYDDVRPKPENGFATPEVGNVTQCKDLCESDEGCESFAITQTETDITCYHYQYGRHEYIQQGLLRDDPGSIYYDPLFFEADIDWREERAVMQQQFEHGCHDIETVEEYLPLVALSEQKLLTSMKCADTCRSLGYRFSGVRIDKCRCGKEIPSEEGLIDDGNNAMPPNDTTAIVCSFNCTGDAGQRCGGENMYTVQVILDDPRYLGCFDDNIHHMPIRRWGKEANKTVEDCIQECARIHFNYAGIQDGGACFCGFQFPLGAGVPLALCDEPCVADGSNHWCGSENYNSVYRTHASFDLTDIKVSHHAMNLYHDQATLSTLDTMMFTVFPQLRNFVSKKLVLSAAVPFMAPEEDLFCSTGECYRPCGNLNTKDQVAGDKEHVIIRQFTIRFSEVKELLVNKTPKQVTIYAQAVIIDISMDLDYALVVRARQIFLNREFSIFIRSSKNANSITLSDDEWQRVVNEGLYPDLLFQRISYTCVRILTGKKDQTFTNIGHGIINDLAASPVKDSEHEAMVRTAQALRAQMLGTDYTNTHVVPLYNKDHLISILETYYDQISVYKRNHDRLQDNNTAYKDFLKIAEEMNSIHRATVVNDALVSVKNIEETYGQVTTVQSEAQSNYLTCVKEIQAARTDIIDDIEKEYETPEKKAKLSFFAGLGGVIKGATKMNYGEHAQSAGSIFGSPKKLEITFHQLAAMVAQMDTILDKSENILLEDKENEEIIRKTEGKLLVDIQVMVSMSPNIDMWQALKNYSNTVVADMGGASAGVFKKAMSEYCVWADTFSQAMISRAETLRQLLEKRAVYDLRKLQEERAAKVIHDAECSSEEVASRAVASCKKHEVLHVMREQILDVSLDLNEKLSQFCQAHFLESLRECREEYQPSFGSDMGSLLLKLNAAKRDSLYSPDMLSSVSKSAIVTDKMVANATCGDPLTHQITCLKINRFLVLTISPDDDNFKDIQKYRVKEVSLDLKNLNLSQNTDKMKFFLTNTGLFLDKRGDVFNFLTRPVHLGFEKELGTTGHITIRADFQDDTHQTTPFTTWIIKISDEDKALDLKNVNEIHVRFDGLGII